MIDGVGVLLLISKDYNHAVHWVAILISSFLNMLFPSLPSLPPALSIKAFVLCSSKFIYWPPPSGWWDIGHCDSWGAGAIGSFWTGVTGGATLGSEVGASASRAGARGLRRRGPTRPAKQRRLAWRGLGLALGRGGRLASGLRPPWPGGIPGMWMLSTRPLGNSPGEWLKRNGSSWMNSYFPSYLFQMYLQ